MRFDKKTYRKGTGSLKWDENPNIEYPLWVADMDFEVAPSIKEALEQRVHHGIFGYALPTDSFYESIIKWHLRRHHALYSREWIITVPGVVPAISSILRALTKPGDGVLTLSPVYNCFYSSIRNLQCRAEESVLRQVGDTYQIDFDDLEHRASKEDTKVLLLCSPHNPSGRVWTQEELQRIGDICLNNNVFIVSDEIHCDIVEPGEKYHPILSITDSAISLLAPTKTFNMAGIQAACIVCPNQELKDKVESGVGQDDVGEPNYFSCPATIAAFKYGDEWVKEMNEYVYNNKRYMQDFISSNLPELHLIDNKATYLLWLDISKYTNDSEAFAKDLREKTGLFVSPGKQFGRGGESFLRINVATSLDNIKDACERLKNYVKTL